MFKLLCSVLLLGLGNFTSRSCLTSSVPEYENLEKYLSSKSPTPIINELEMRINKLSKTEVSIPEENYKAWSAIDSFILDLEMGDWADENCIQDTLIFLNAVRDDVLWAKWVWDSMQPAVSVLYGSKYHLGNFDQCLKPPWPTSERELQMQYCLVDVMYKEGEKESLDAYGDALDYFKSPSIYGRHQANQTIAVCFPAICHASSIAKISKYLFIHRDLVRFSGGTIMVDPKDCQRADDKQEYSLGFYAFWLIFFTLSLICTLATHQFKIMMTSCKNSRDIFAKCCSLQKNFQELFITSYDDISVLHGIRFLTALTVTVLHEMLFLAMPAANLSNTIEFDQIQHSRAGHLLLHADLLVDTFFAMSGMLFIRGLLHSSSADVDIKLVKRFIRLIGPYAVATFYFTSVAQHVGEGPLWSRRHRLESDHCDECWWMNLLMVNLNLDTMCNFMSWYVPCDYQLTVIAAAIFSLCNKNRRLCVALFLFTAGGCTLNLGLEVYWKHLPILPFQDITLAKDMSSHRIVDQVYLKSHHRAGPYFIGVMMAFVIASYNPKIYKQFYSKKQSYVAILASIAVMGLALSVGLMLSSENYNPLIAAVLVSTNRMFWAAAICCIIGVYIYGDAPLITNFLCWPGFIPLSKLSYCLYLVHPFVIRKRMYSTRNGIYFSFFTVLVNGAGTAVTSMIPALILYLLVEAPLVNWINTILPNQKPNAYYDCATSQPDTEQLQKYYTPQNKKKE